MKSSVNFLRVFFLAVVTLLTIVSCASSDVTTRREFAKGSIPKPGRIIVEDIAGTPEDIDRGSTIDPYVSMRSKPQTPEQKELGRILGNLIADYLVKDILALGMPAERESAYKPPQVGDVIITGELFSIKKGSRMKRMVIGFGVGANELKTHIVAYQMTPNGLSRIGDAEFKAGGGKMPGMAIPIVGGAVAGSVAVSAAISGGMNVMQEIDPESMEGAAKRTAKEITKVLSQTFVRQGWISASKAK